MTVVVGSFIFLFCLLKSRMLFGGRGDGVDVVRAKIGPIDLVDRFFGVGGPNDGLFTTVTELVDQAETAFNIDKIIFQPGRIDDLEHLFYFLPGSAFDHLLGQVVIDGEMDINDVAVYLGQAQTVEVPVAGP